jgi:beta,beta-carotene 9',10'-dioxygenase
VLLRTGRPLNHWFDGLAMLHRFSIHNGHVSYANRFLHSAAFRAAEQQHRIAYSEFATDPCMTLFRRLKVMFVGPEFTDNGNVSVQALDGKIVALSETTLPVMFDPDTLQSLGVFGYDARLAGQVSFAHPHYDFTRGCEYSYFLKFARHSVYRLFKLAFATGRQELVAEIPVDRLLGCVRARLSTRLAC